MKKYAVIICAMALCAACGDNKTKEKVINGTVISGAGAGTTTGIVTTPSGVSANMAVKLQALLTH
jgi:hypothetical protein